MRFSLRLNSRHRTGSHRASATTALAPYRQEPTGRLVANQGTLIVLVDGDDHHRADGRLNGGTVHDDQPPALAVGTS
jgi:hypothetical protein